MAKIVVNKITGDVIEGYDQKDLSLIPAFEATSQFTPSTDVVEFSIYNEQGLLEHINTNYKDYLVTLNYNSQNNSVSTVTVDPEKDTIKEGYEQGNYTVYYNFIRNVASSSISSPYFLSQISSDRTELRVINNSLDNNELEQAISSLIEELNDSPYFEDFRLNFSNNNIFIANNVLLDKSDEGQYTVLIKLYEPLPTQIELKDSLTIALQTADEVSFNIRFENKVIPDLQPKKLGAPNFDLTYSNKGNNDTSFKTAQELLLGASLTSSYDQVQAILNQKGVTVNIDYSDFNNFVYFSSAEQRVKNLSHKINLIRNLTDDITTVGSIDSTSQVSSSIAILEQKRQNVIKSFDGYESYQYYTSGSQVEIGNVYPKKITVGGPPYEPVSSTSTSAQTWLTASLATASLYDLESVDRLANSLPTYVQDDSRNTSFLLFMDMVGHHFDNIWIYTKDISNRFDSDNRLDYGVSKDIVKDALVSMGVNVYGNNQSDFNLYSALTQINEDGTTGLPSGSGEINTSTTNIADPEPKEDIIKGVYKRIFHNLPYLLKKKGSYQGLRALINTFGVPGGMLQIGEFGGWKKDDTKFKYYKQTDNLGFTGGLITTNGLNAKSGTPFSGAASNVAFRFKWLPNTLPANTTSYNIGSFGSTLTLEYTGGGTTGSYSGSIASSSLNEFKGELAIGSANITAPFFNGEWWSVNLSNGQTIKCGMNSHESGDGFEPSYILGGSGNATVGGSSGRLFGNGGDTDAPINKFAFQELRYYTNTISTTLFKNFVMNPYQLGVSSGDVTSDVYNTLYFRAPLGSDGIRLSAGSHTSIHPRQEGASTSFQADSFSGGSTYQIGNGTGTVGFEPNKEFVYFNEPGSGIKNRINRAFSPKTNTSIITGETLSNLSSIDQRKLNINSSYDFPDIDYLEVGFSPQNEINDDIASTFGDNLDLNFSIANPSHFQPNSLDKNNSAYPRLYHTSSFYFEKYSKAYDWHDYTRLIKYFDSSLFKMIKEFTPVKSNVTTGVVIKQHLLERSKAIVQSASIEDTITHTGSTSTIGIAEGGAGGVFNAVNGLSYYLSGSTFDAQGNLNGGFKPHPPSSNIPTPFVSQSFLSTISTAGGDILVINDTQQEFYNGELGGTTITVTNGDLIDPRLTEKIGEDNGFADTWSGFINYNKFRVGTSFGPGNIQVIASDPSTYQVDRIAFNSKQASSGEDYDTQLQTLSIGSSITVKSNGPYPAFLTFNITAIERTLNTVSGGHNYTLGLTQQSGLTGDWYTGIIPLVGGSLLTSWDGVNSVDIIFDPAASIDRSVDENSIPIYNNVNDNRSSNRFMDVDYSEQGSGSLVPVNLGQILDNSALAAQVQDYNYEIESWTNSRYRGVKNSSIGFNIPYKAN